jgi:lipase maturation factor 1
LLEKNPFPDKPPVYLRALLYDYNYADSNAKAEGVWWKRKLLGPYFPRSLFER